MSHEEQHNIVGWGIIWSMNCTTRHIELWFEIINQFIQNTIYSQFRFLTDICNNWNYSLKVINISRKIHQGTLSVLLSKRKWLIYIPQRAETKEFIASRAGGSWCLICTWDSVPLANFNPVLLPRILQDKTKNVVTEKLIQE